MILSLSGIFVSPPLSRCVVLQRRRQLRRVLIDIDIDIGDRDGDDYSAQT
jgi:hypothetical protein